MIRGFQSYIPLRLPFSFYTWAWCRSVAPSRQKRIRRLEAKSERLAREKLDIARLMRIQSRYHLVEQMLLTGQQKQFVKLLENKSRLVLDSDSSDEPRKVD